MFVEVEQVGDGVLDDDAIAAIAGLGDDPTLIEEGGVGGLGGVEVGDEGSGFGTIAVRDEEKVARPGGSGGGVAMV